MTFEEVLVMQWKELTGVRRPGFTFGPSADLLSHVAYVLFVLYLGSSYHTGR